MDDEPRQLFPDTPRPTATHFSLTLRDVAAKFVEAGLPRDLRTLQRYCASGLLTAIQEKTASGMQYFVDPASVEHAIRQLAQMHVLTGEARHSPTTTGVSDFVEPQELSHQHPDAPRPAAVQTEKKIPENVERQTPSDPDMPRQTPAEAVVLSQRVVELETENRFLKRENEILQAHITSERESKAVLHSLSTMLETLGQRLPRFLLNSDDRGNRIHSTPPETSSDHAL